MKGNWTGLLRLAAIGLLAGLSFFLIACGGSGGGSTAVDIAGSSSAGVLTGRIVAPPDLKLNLNHAAVSANQVPRALVWLEDFPANTALTDENGTFILNNVQYNRPQRLVCRYDIAVSGEVYLVRSEPITISPGEGTRKLDDLRLSKGLYPIAGILRDQIGNPVPNARLRLWGIEFSTDGDGNFRSPPLPESADRETLQIKAGGFRDFSVELPILRSEDNLVKFDLTLSDLSEPNLSPVPYFVRVPAKVSPNERILIELQVIDPDELRSDQFKPVWAANAGIVESTADPLQIYWTAPESSGLATITASVTDSRGAVGRVELGLAVGGDRNPTIRIDSVSPSGAAVGQRVLISGSGFGSDTNLVKISFNGRNAPVFKCSDVQIETEVPAGATTGILLLTIGSLEKSAGIFTILDGELAISPVYGPPGSVITILGSDFGEQNEKSRVLVNGVAAKTQQWSDSQVVAEIPVGASAGVVSVETGGKIRSAGMFKVTRLFSISSRKSSFGSQIIITGEGWGDAQSDSQLVFSGNAPANILSWNDGRVVFTVPEAATSGNLLGLIHGKSFVLAEMQICSLLGLSHDLAVPGQEVILSGIGFSPGAKAGSVTVGKVVADVVAWGNDGITIKLPLNAVSGDVIVSCGDHFSNALRLNVLRIDSISHLRRPVGSRLLIDGGGFGTDRGYVWFGEKLAVTIPAWSDNRIEVVIPEEISGSQEVVVSTLGVRSAPVDFIAAEFSSLDPLEGWRGRELIISGAGLGNGSGTDRVTVGEFNAPVISWEDTQIRVRVPINAVTAPVNLIVGDWPVLIAEEFVVYPQYDYVQESPDWSGPRAESRPLLPGIAINSDGETFLSDFDNGWIWKISAAGEQSKFGNFSGPWGIALSPDEEELYVADSGNDQVKVFDVNGNFKRSLGSSGSGDGQFVRPRGLVFSGEGLLFVADSGNDRVQVFSDNGDYLTQFGSSGSANGRFSSPSGLAVDENHVVYVADAGNHRVQRFFPDAAASPGAWNFAGWLGSSDPNISTPGWQLAGNGLASNLDGGFNNPYGVGLADAEKLLVADTNNNRVQVFNLSTGLFENGIGAGGITSGQYNQPLALLYSDDEIFIADSSNARVQVSTLDGEFRRSFAPDTSILNTDPRRIAVDSKNRRVYVLDTADSSITVYDLDGNVVAVIGSKGSGREQFFLPEGICVDNQGNVFVADTGNARIQKISAQGDFLQKWGVYGTGAGQFQSPNAIAVSPDGSSLFITDAKSHRVQKFSAAGSFENGWGRLGNDDDGFNHPAGIAVDFSGMVYIADKNNHRIKKYSSDGSFVGWWGSYDAGAQSFWLDPDSNRSGALSDADGAFDSPTDVAVDGEGNVFVTDSNNFRIQRFAPEQSTLENAGFQTDIYLGDNLQALAVDAWARIYCLNSAKKLQRFLPDP